MPQQPNYDGEFFDTGRQYFERGLPIWREFVLNTLKAKSLADFGCGQGDWLEVVQDTIPVWGCDYGADEQHLRIKPENFRKLDLTLVKPKDLDVGKRDVVMSLEAMEHLAAVHEGNFLDCLLHPKPRLVVLGVASGWGTYDPNATLKVNRLGEALPGGPDWHPQWGRHHVNCQPVSVVIEKMAKRGYVVDADLSEIFASLRVAGRSKKGRMAFASFYHKNTRVYRKA